MQATAAPLEVTFHGSNANGAQALAGTPGRRQRRHQIRRPASCRWSGQPLLTGRRGLGLGDEQGADRFAGSQAQMASVGPGHWQ